LFGVQVSPCGVDPVSPVLVVVEPDVVVDIVVGDVVVVDVVVGDVVLVPDLVDVRVSALRFIFAAAEFPFAVVDFVGFMVAPLEVDIVFGPAEAPCPFTAASLRVGPFINAAGVVLLEPCTFGIADAPLGVAGVFGPAEKPFVFTVEERTVVPFRDAAGVVVW
jgi:hypothetical protein